MAPTQDRVAVIGGTGFIGSHLVERLVREHRDVTVLARSPKRLDNLTSVNGAYDFLLCDVTDRRKVLEALAQVRPRVVFHLAAHADGAENFEQMLACLHINTIGTVHVIEAAALAGAELVVYVDSSKVYGNGSVPFRENQPGKPISSYAIAKSAAWNMCQLASALTGLQVCGLRPTFVYGSRQNWNLITYVEDCVRRGISVRLQGSTQTRDLMHVDDMVDAMIAATGRRAAWGHCIPIGGGFEIGLRDLTQSILNVLGSQAEIVENAEQPRLTEIWRSFCDNEDARRMLEWYPRVPILQGLRRTLTLHGDFAARSRTAAAGEN